MATECRRAPPSYKSQFNHWTQVIHRISAMLPSCGDLKHIKAGTFNKIQTATRCNIKTTHTYHYSFSADHMTNCIWAWCWWIKYEITEVRCDC